MPARGGLAVPRAVPMIAWRLLGLVMTLLVTSFLVFASLYIAPGDPIDFLIQGRSPSPEAIASIKAQYGLDDPFLVQYLNWLATPCTATSDAPSSTATTSRR